MPGVVKPATDDPDATIIAPGASSQGTPRTAASPQSQVMHGNLPPGYRLAEFEVHEQLGRGGFSVVYKVFDHRLEQFRALKEYFPRDFAQRLDDLRVQPRTRRDDEIFGIGLEHFVSEGKTLAKFNHPSLVHVYQTIEANGTAYMVMHLAQGDTLEEAVTAMAAPPDEAWLMKLLDALTAALNVVHDANVVHRDIKPENIVLLQGTLRPVLLDFGAARQVIDRSSQPTGILTPGYAPFEQYPDSGLQQGPWTDIYALAATVHRVLTGKAPPNAMARRVKDTYEPLSKRLAGRYSDRFLNTLDACLAIDPGKRPRSMDALRLRLGLQAGAFDEVASPGTTGAKPPRLSPAIWAAVGAAALVAAGVGAFLVISGSDPPQPAAGQPSAAAPRGEVPGPVAQAPAASASPPMAPSVAPPAVLPATSSAPLTPSPPPSGTISKADGPIPAGSLPTEPEAAFDHIVQGSAPAFGVRLDIENPRLVVDQTPYRLRIKSAQSGHFYVLIHDTDGEVRLLHPDALHADSRITAGQTLFWPPKGDDRLFGEPIGKARIMVVVSAVPLDFGPSTKRRDDVWRVLFQGPEATKAAARQPEGRHLYLGRPKCPREGECNTAYGAAGARLEVVR